jgi:hypothetical protein
MIEGPTTSEAAGSNARRGQIWFNTEDAACHLGIAPNTLKKWRALRQGPLFYRIGKKAIRYSIDDLEAFARRS